MKLRQSFASVAIAALMAVPAQAADNKSYDYGTERGAEKWGQLHSDYAICESGNMQSPIDLAGANAIGNVAVAVDYKSGPMGVTNKGLTVQNDFAAGSTMTSGGMTFSLIQIHFHTPSEHAISGKRFPLTGHFVHATADGKLGVLGVMFEEGAANPELAKILATTPSSKSDVKAGTDQMIDPAGMLPEDLAVYRYMGSLTTPPCSEGVNWHVLRDSVTASKEQIEAFENLMGDSARPVRALNNRLVVAPE
jgi:carbonic anhydrase